VSWLPKKNCLKTELQTQSLNAEPGFATFGDEDIRLRSLT